MSQLTRENIPKEETWDLTPIYKNDQEWKQTYKRIDDQISLLLEQPFSIENAREILASLKSYDDLLGNLNRLSNYAMYRYSEDGTNSDNQEMIGLSQILLSKANEVKVYFIHSLLNVDKVRIEQYLKKEEKLRAFSRFFERLNYMRKHTLLPQVEDALANLDQTFRSPESVFQAITSTDMTFKPVLNEQGDEQPVSLHMYMTQVETSPDTTLRRNAYESLTNGLKKYQHGLSKVLANEINNNVSLAKLRGFPSALDMHLQYSVPSMTGYATDRTTTNQFEQIIDTFRLGLAPHMQRYAKLRKKQLGLDELLFSDVKAPLDPSFDPKITFEEAGRIIVEAVGVLGTEYQDQMRRVFEERWVYRADNIGRRMIPFGGGVHGVHGYSFYPWGGSLFDLLLLGHELGHTLHYTLSGQNQRIINNSQSLLFVEAPSTLIEHLIINYLRDNRDDPRLLRWLNMYLMMSYHHNCVTHILEAELLRRLYKTVENKTPLTTGVMNETKGAILSEFWGDTVVIDEGAKLSWMKQPHYYMGVYPFTYSIGMSASTIISEQIKQEGTKVGEQWTDVLKQGGNVNGYDLYSMAGLDMSTTKNMERTVARVGSIVDELETSF